MKDKDKKLTKTQIYHIIIKAAVAILVIAAFFVPLYFVCRHFGLNTVSGIQDLIVSCGVWGWLAYIGLYIILCIILCIVPGTSMTMILAAVLVWGANWKTFLLCFSAVVLTSVVLDLLGRFGGAKVIRFIVGAKTYDEAVNLLSIKGTVYVPVMYLLPLFPDDAICMCCGMIKVKWWVHLIEIILCRGIGCATIVFGISVIPYQTFDCLYDWVVCATVVVVWVGLMLIVARRIDKRLSKKDTL